MLEILTGSLLLLVAILDAPRLVEKLALLRR